MSDSYPDMAGLLPHDHPMILIDRVVKHDETGITCETDINANTPFFKGNGVGSWVGIEYMAQSIAAFSGLDKKTRAEEPRIGFLLGIRYYHCRVPLFKEGWTLVTRAEPEMIAVEGLASVKCSITLKGETEPLVESSVSVYEAKDGKIIHK